MLFFRVRGYCIVLAKIKPMSLCLFWLVEEIFSMQFFCNIQRKTNYPWAIREFKISHQTFLWWYKTLLDEIWTQAYSEPFKHLRWSVFKQTINGLMSLTGRCLNGVLNMLLLKSKAIVRCPKRTLDTGKYKVNVRDIYFAIFQWY